MRAEGLTINYAFEGVEHRDRDGGWMLNARARRGVGGDMEMLERDRERESGWG